MRVGSESVLPTLTPAQLRSAAVGKPARRRGGVPMNVARALVDSARLAARSAGEPVNEPGPEIRVRPFDPGSVSAGAVGAKALLSFMAGVRGRANYRAERDRLAAKEQRDADLAESQMLANAARAASYDRQNTGGMSAYEQDMMNWRRDPKNPANRPRQSAGGAMGTAMLSLMERALQNEAEAAGLWGQADEDELTRLRTDALSGSQRAGDALRQIGVTLNDWKWANAQKDRAGGRMTVVDAALARYRAAKAAEKKRAGLTGGSALVRSMLSSLGRGYPSAPASPSAGGEEVSDPSFNDFEAQVSSGLRAIAR